MTTIRHTANKPSSAHSYSLTLTLLLLLLMTSSSPSSRVTAQSLLGCRYADIAFVVDSSDSISPEFWRDDVKPFLVSFVDALEIGTDAVQVGVVQYSSNVNTAFYLNEHRDKTSLTRALRNITNFGSKTNTAAGLDALVSELFVRENGDRFDAPNIGIVITDGQSNVRQDDVETSAAAVRTRGIDLIASFSRVNDLNVLAIVPFYSVIRVCSSPVPISLCCTYLNVNFLKNKTS